MGERTNISLHNKIGSWGLTRVILAEVALDPKRLRQLEWCQKSAGMGRGGDNILCLRINHIATNERANIRSAFAKAGSVHASRRMRGL